MRDEAESVGEYREHVFGWVGALSSLFQLHIEVTSMLESLVSEDSRL